MLKFNSVLVYCLAFMTLGLPGWKERFGRYRFPVALMSSAVFALHPINIIQRMVTGLLFLALSSIFFILSRAYFIRGDREKARLLLQEAATMKDVPENVRKMIDNSLKES